MSPTTLKMPILHHSHDPAYLSTSATKSTLSPYQLIPVAVLSAICTLLLATLLYCLARIVSHHISRISVPDALSQPVPERKSAATEVKDMLQGKHTRNMSSHWPRKDSDVLWSMYVTDDDLAKQFHWSRRPSRLFSIGSIGNESDIHPSSGRRRSTFGMEKGPLDRSSFESVRLPDCPAISEESQLELPEGPVTAATAEELGLVNIGKLSHQVITPNAVVMDPPLSQGQPKALKGIRRGAVDGISGTVRT